MRKILIGFALTALLHALCLPVWAQQPTKKVPRIGLLSTRFPGPDPGLEALRQGLRDLGYIDGKNITIEFLYAEGNIQRLPELAAELVRLKVDIIVTSDLRAALNARKVTTTVPIVMGSGRDPVEAGLAASLARPGGNVTGLTNIAPELLGKRLELLKEALPRISRVAVLLDTSAGGRTPVLVKEMQGPAQNLGIKLQPVEVQSPNPDFDQAFRRITGDRGEALIIAPQPPLSAHLRRIVELVTKNRLPTMTAGSAWVDAGALMSYGANGLDLYRRAATYVDRILKGAKPAGLPIEQPTKFDLVINLKTAKQIGVTIPQSVLYRADKVIK